MGRKRAGTISESPETLAALLEQNLDTAAEPRLKLLLALANQPDLKVEALVGLVGYSERTIRRWWRTYQLAGVTGLLKDSPPQFAVCAEAPTVYCDRECESLVVMLNSVAQAMGSVEWLTTIERTMTDYLGVVVQIRFPAASGANELSGGVEVEISEGASVVGVVCLAPSDDSAKSLEAAIEKVTELRGFLYYLLLDASLRTIGSGDARDQSSQAVMRELAAQTLSPRERDVLILRLQGNTYAATAQNLGITEETVHKYVKSIYQKTSTSSIEELFVRYFTAFGNVAGH